MQIQPIQPVEVLLKCGETELRCKLIELTESEMTVNSSDFIEKESSVVFVSKFFRGEAIVREFGYKGHKFTYKLDIGNIRYQPGLLINTSL